MFLPINLQQLSIWHTSICYSSPDIEIDGAGSWSVATATLYFAIIFLSTLPLERQV